VESVGRPDTQRVTSPLFFDLLNGDKESVALDLSEAHGREALLALLARAELVVSSARPRAFEQMGVNPAKLMRANPRMSWVAITAYGWNGEHRNAIGFGDDVAAGAGLLHWSGRSPSFVGDAIADPLTGIAAAAAAVDAIDAGGGVFVDASLYAVARYVAAAASVPRARPDPIMIQAPRARACTSQARRFGEDTAAVLRELAGISASQVSQELQ